MEFPRTEKVLVDEANDDIVFQVVAWDALDVDFDDEEECDEDSSRYVIKVYGVNEKGQSVALNVTNYTPFFMVKLNRQVTGTLMKRLHEHVVSSLPYKLKGSFINIKPLKKKDFWGFKNGETFNFLRLTFKNLKGFRAGIRIFHKEVKLIGIDSRPIKYQLYESNIEPFLRFIHIRNLSPSGWIKIPKSRYNINETLMTTQCQIDVTCDWKYVEPEEKDKLAPLVIASFDLECTSSHGDFPVARKDYKKTAFELMQSYNSEVLVTSADIIHAIMMAFNHKTPGILSKVFPKDAKYLDPDHLNEAVLKRIRNNIDDIMNILKGKATIKDGKFCLVAKTNKEDIVKSITYKLGSYGTDNLWTGILPTLEGDPIIQIGTTVHRYGETDCSYKNIVTLGTCEPIEGVTVVQCKTEKELMLAWRDLINKIDPDVITGYNIFGFDMSYLYDRSKELGIDTQFCKLGKLLDKSCEYVQKNLSSSALGDNILKFINMDGRVLIDIMKVVQRDHKLDSYKLDNVANTFMKMNKHDVSPNDIFKLQKGSAADRRVVAEYCVQDCALCNKLMMKLEILANNIGMSNVCSVPLAYIFMRGQGIKIFSLVAKQCREDDFIIPTLCKVNDATSEGTEEDEDSYEGAIVLEPKEGIYMDDPVSVLDYASLYPSSMISENLSHDCIVLDSKYDNLPGVEYLDIPYDIYEGSGDKKQKVGERVCRYVQFPNNEKGVIPRILMKLLKARKDTRKKIEFQTVTLKDGSTYSGLIKESDSEVRITYLTGESNQFPKYDVINIKETYGDFEKAVLDGLQLAYKVTANSLYGQIGAKTSPIYMKDIAACTTATGRKMITMARDFILENYEGAHIVYGDTDSIFVRFDTKDEHGNPLKGKNALSKCRELGIECSKKFKCKIKHPHDLEWEKMFFPFILFSKKRYVGNMYEHDDNHFKQKSMGIVLKRRDNANIVKQIYGGILDIILNKHDIKGSVEFLKDQLNMLVEGKCPLENLIITKSLKSEYKDPTKIAHKVLAERMGERDAGTKPQVNDRIPFVYIQKAETNKQKVLQGERIEHPDYIRANKLQPDYEFYITNQIMKPVLQLYALALNQLDNYKKKSDYFPEIYKKILKEKEGDAKKAKEKLQDLKEEEVKKLLFDPYLIALENKKQGIKPLTEYFKPIPKNA